MYELILEFLNPLGVNTAVYRSLSELLIAKLEAPQLSIRAAKKWGILDLSTSFHYDQLEVLGNLFINGLITLKDFLSFFLGDTKICDATYLKIEGNNYTKKGSNYGYIFMLSLVYNFIQHLRLYLVDMSFKDILDALSTYLLRIYLPKCLFSLENACEDVFEDIRRKSFNKINNGLMGSIFISGRVTS